jgi:large subunit ribosomal protein L21
MFCRSIRPSLIGSKWACSSSTTSHAPRICLSTTSIPPSTSHPETTQLPIEQHTSTSASSISSTSPSKTYVPRHPALPSRPPPTPSPPIVEQTLHPSIPTLLPLLRAQPPFFAQLHIHGKPYLVTAGDTLRLPALLQGVNAGDILRFNRIALLGSRDYTLKAPTTSSKAEGKRWLDERLYVVRARVLGVVREPERLKVKKKARQRHARFTWSQHAYTVLRIMEVSVCEPEVEGMKSIEGEISERSS